MILKYTFDIQSKQPVYAICTVDGECKFLTTSITKAIKLIQTK